MRARSAASTGACASRLALRYNETLHDDQLTAREMIVEMEQGVAYNKHPEASQ